MSTPRYLDGQLHETPLTDRARFEFPFLENPLTPDPYSRILERKFIVNPTRYTPRINQRTSYTNLLPHSNAYTADWTTYHMTPTAAALANPWDGTVTTSKLLEGATTSTHGISQGITLTAVPTTFWAIVKGGLGRDWVMIECADSAATTFKAWFNITTGSKGSTGGTGTCTALTPVNLGNGYWLVAITFTPAAGTGTFYAFAADADTSTSYAGNTAKGFYLAQLQVEAAATVGPLIITTTIAVTISAPDLDAIANSTAPDPDWFSFLVWESPKPDYLGGGRWAVTRRYARIPATQYEPDSKFFTRPLLSGLIQAGSPNTYAVSFDDGTGQSTSHLFTSRKAITRVASVEAKTTTAGMPTSNIVFTDSLGNVLNLPANSTKAATESAFAALTAIISPVATVSSGSLQILWNRYGGGGYMASVAPPSGVFVPYFDQYSDVVLISIGTATTPATTTFDCASHGFAVGDKVAFWAGNTFLFIATVKQVPTADNFVVTTTSIDTANSLIDYCQAAKNGTRYVNGPVDCSARRVRRFYLPGVTSGIATSADIPGFASVTDPVTWLAQLIAYAASPSVNTYAVQSTDDLKSYAGLILEKSVIEVQLADAIKTVTASA